MKQEVIRESFELRDEDLLGVENYNETLDRCKYSYILTKFMRRKDIYTSVERVVVAQIFSEEPVYDFRPVLENMDEGNFVTIHWELKG